MANMAFETITIEGKDVMVFLHTKVPPDAESWMKAIEGMRECERKHAGNIDHFRIFAISDGGSPDAGMRNEFNTFLNGRKLRVAVVTEHVLARGAVTAISWFNPLIKAFSPRNIKVAVEHLELPAAAVGTLLGRLRLMEADTGPVSALNAAMPEARAS